MESLCYVDDWQTGKSCWTCKHSKFRHMMYDDPGGDWDGYDYYEMRCRCPLAIEERKYNEYRGHRGIGCIGISYWASVVTVMCNNLCPYYEASDTARDVPEEKIPEIQRVIDERLELFKDVLGENFTPEEFLARPKCLRFQKTEAHIQCVHCGNTMCERMGNHYQI